MSELLGVPLSDFAEPIRIGLNKYAEITDGAIDFDLDSAGKLELTPNESTSARSETLVKYLGEVVSTLHVVAFAPKDSTDLRPTGMISEAHLTLLAQRLEITADPVLFAGNLGLMIPLDNHMVKGAELGQRVEAYKDAVNNGHSPSPVSSLTVGYKSLSGPNNLPWDFWRLRFGDPHAVLNPHNELQVCGFIGVARRVGAKSEDLDPLRALKTVDPVRLIGEAWGC